MGATARPDRDYDKQSSSSSDAAQLEDVDDAGRLLDVCLQPFSLMLQFYYYYYYLAKLQNSRPA